MKNILLHGLGVAVLSLTIAVPAYAHPAHANGGNGGLGNGMGTSTRALSEDGSAGASTVRRHDVSVYGTGTGSQFLNVNADAGRTMDRQPMNRAYSNANNNGYRALDTAATRRDMDWGWLGLLGLLGLFGMRSRHPQRDR